MEGSALRSKGSQCYTCKGYGHLQAQCPNHVVGLSNKQSLEEEVYIQHQSMILEVAQAGQGEASVSEDYKTSMFYAPF